MQQKLINDLVFGDRFYYPTDNKKIVWEVSSIKQVQKTVNGLRRWCRQVQQRDNHHFKKFSLITTNVVYLRNALHNDNICQLTNTIIQTFKNTNDGK
jgi:hypothetical protein